MHKKIWVNVAEQYNINYESIEGLSPLSVTLSSVGHKDVINASK